MTKNHFHRRWNVSSKKILPGLAAVAIALTLIVLSVMPVSAATLTDSTDMLGSSLAGATTTNTIALTTITELPTNVKI